MNILITINNTYIPYAATVLQSLVDSNPNILFNVYVICPDITAENKLKMEESFNAESHMGGGAMLSFPTIYDNIASDIEEASRHLAKDFNASFILRLYATRILDENIHQILYLDADTIISSSLEELANYKFEDEIALAAVKDLIRPYEYERLEIDQTKHIYFNSGVMLLNLDYWRKYNIGEKCVELLIKNSQIYKFPDQDVLNVVCQGHTAYLHPRYNCLTFFYSRREHLKARIREEEFDKVIEAAKHPAIIHYTWPGKPWHKGSFVPHRELWQQSLAKTKWKSTPIKYKQGVKGFIINTIKGFLSRVLPLIGLHLKSDIYIKRRYKHMYWLSILIYYSFAYWLPNFDSRYCGKLANSIRLLCVKHIFDYVGDNVIIDRKVRFGNGKKVYIDSRSNIGENCLVPADIIIGKDVMMGPNNFFFGNFTHNISDTTKPMIKQGFRTIEGRTEIKDDVFIGRECLFMPCLVIGSHSVVGARSVVTKNVPERVIVAGNPARIIKERK